MFMYYKICVSFIVDVDECLSPNACGSEHVCNNTVGSYACECPLGYVADSGPQNPLDPVCVGKELYHFFIQLILLSAIQLVGKKGNNRDF